MTPDTIQQAITQLEAIGARVSVRRVHRLIGGSFRDISRQLRALRPTRPTATARSLQIALAEQEEIVRLYRRMVQNAAARQHPRWATLLRQSEDQLTRLRAVLRREGHT